MTATSRRRFTPKRLLAAAAAVLAILAAATSLRPHSNDIFSQTNDIPPQSDDISPQRTQRVAEENGSPLRFSASSAVNAPAGNGAAARSPAVSVSGMSPAVVNILAAEIEHEDDHVTALELAQWIRERKPGLRVVDVRSDSEFAAYHIPSAERMPLGAVATLAPRDGETLVLYSEGGAHAAQGWVLLRANGHRRVYFLRGGLLDWMDDVMSPTLPTDTSRAGIAALSRYFGGVPRAGAVPLPTAPVSAAAAIARVRRRGC